MKPLTNRKIFEGIDATIYHQKDEQRYSQVSNEFFIFLHHSPLYIHDMMLSCELYCRNTTWKGYYHRRINPSFLSLSIVQSGESYVHCGDEYFIAEQGDIILLHPGSDYEFMTPVQCEKSGMLIGGKIIGEIMNHSKLKDLHVTRLNSNAVLENYFAMIDGIMQESGRKSVRRAVSNLCFEMLQYLAEPDQSNIYPNELSAAIELVNTAYSQDISVDDLAHAGECSTAKITRLFKEYLDTTPYKYLTSRRMHQAEVMLTQHKLTVKEIAQMVGYNNPLNFSTEFKKFFGRSPRNLHR